MSLWVFADIHAWWLRPLRFGRIAFLAGLMGLAVGAASAEPLDDAGMTLRYQQRSRYEYLDAVPRLGVKPTDRALALQTSVFVEGGQGKVRFLGEVMDVRTELNDAGSYLTTTHVNALEPLQSYLTWNASGFLAAGSTSALKAGRFTMDLGRRRLIARSGFRNSVNTFSGLDWTWDGGNGRGARAFVVAPMRILPTEKAALLENDPELDHGNRGTVLRGAVYQFPPWATRERLELYWVELNQSGRPGNDAPPRDLDSVSFRVWRPSIAGTWSYEVEAVLQQGKSSVTVAGVTRRGLEHDAEFYHAELGYTFASRLSPVVLLQYDRASGDRDPYDDQDEGYDTLYGERRFDFAPQGIYGLFARGNLRAPGVRVTFVPWRGWQAMFSYRSFALDQARDAWSGVGLRDLTGRAGRQIGRQLEGSLTWSVVDERLAFETGFAQLWAGEFFRETVGAGFRGNPTYVYTMVTTKFGGRHRVP